MWMDEGYGASFGSLDPCHYLLYPTISLRWHSLWSILFLSKSLLVSSIRVNWSGELSDYSTICRTWQYTITALQNYWLSSSPYDSATYGYKSTSLRPWRRPYKALARVNRISRASCASLQVSFRLWFMKIGKHKHLPYDITYLSNRNGTTLIVGWVCSGYIIISARMFFGFGKYEHIIDLKFYCKMFALRTSHHWFYSQSARVQLIESSRTKGLLEIHCRVVMTTYTHRHIPSRSPGQR